MWRWVQCLNIIMILSYPSIFKTNFNLHQLRITYSIYKLHTEKFQVGYRTCSPLWCHVRGWEFSRTRMLRRWFFERVVQHCVTESPPCPCNCLSARCRRPRPTWWTTAASRPGTTPCSWASRPQTTPSRTKSPALYCSGRHLAFATLLVFLRGWGLSVLLQSLFLWGFGVGGCWLVGSCHYHVFTRFP